MTTREGADSTTGGLYWLLQFRSATDPREEYVVVTNKVRDVWDELALEGFERTAAARLAEVVDGHIEYFMLEKGMYWFKDTLRAEATTG